MKSGLAVVAAAGLIAGAPAQAASLSYVQPSAIIVSSPGPTQATSVSYYLDQSNSLPDDINYLQVTVADGVNGAIDFTVSILGPLMDGGMKRFGIQKFAFNITPGLETEAMDVGRLPAGWRAKNGGRMDGFGRFDIKLVGRGWSRQNELTFSIEGIDGDRPEDYVLLPTGRAPEGDSYFAALVSGFSFNGPMMLLSGFHDACGDLGGMANGYSHGGGYGKKCKGVKKRGGGGGFFGGVTRVPAPPTVWLLATGLIGLAYRRFRRAAA